MNRQAFFANLFPTVLYAFIGTLMSTFVVGGIVWQAGKMGISHPIGGLAALTFGSLISATDPVTVLAVFQALGVKVDLFSMVRTAAARRRALRPPARAAGTSPRCTARASDGSLTRRAAAPAPRAHRRCSASR